MARAKDARVSMIKLIQSIWMGFITYCFITAAPTRVMPTATMLTVNWNWMNFLIAS